MPVQQIDAFAEHHDLTLAPRSRHRFERYLALLNKARTKTNLIGPMGDLDIVETLFCDSLQLLRVVDLTTHSLIDIGSGAGFPGLPLKIARPDIKLTLVEPRGHRYHFLGHVARTLELNHVQRLQTRLEDLQPEALQRTLHHPPTVAVSKAFAPPADWIRRAHTLLPPDGIIAVLASRTSWHTALEQYPHLTQYVLASVDYSAGESAPRIAAALRAHHHEWHALQQ